MMFGVQKARNTSGQQMHKMQRDVLPASALASVVYAGSQGTRAAHAHCKEIFVERKGKRQNAQTVVSVDTGETHATSRKLLCT